MASTVWKGHFAFGLVSIPVKLVCAARADSISFCQLRATDLSRIGNKQYAKADDTLVTKDELIKGYETTKDNYVIITEDELKASAPSSTGNAEIIEFVPASEIDPTLFEQTYWMAPDAGGDKAYALLYDGLQRSNYVGIAKLTMSNREHLIAIRAGKHGIAVHTLYYPHEARAADEYHTDLGKITEQESELAGMLIKTLAASFELDKFRDTYRDNILALIEAKAAGVAAPTLVKQPVAAPSLDLMAALTASLAAKKAAPAKIAPASAPVSVPGPVAAPKKTKKKVA